MNTNKVNIAFLILIIILGDIIYNQQQQIKSLQDTTATLSEKIRTSQSDIYSLLYRMGKLETTTNNNDTYVQDLEDRLSETESQVSKTRYDVDKAKSDIDDTRNDIDDIEGYYYTDTNLSDLDNRLNNVENKLHHNW